MATLRETRDRIASVRSTLKITSAMKLVSSAKLRHAQKEIESLRPYERALGEIYTEVGGARCDRMRDSASPRVCGEVQDFGNKTVVVAIASNSSMCGAFNINVAKEALKYNVSDFTNVEFIALGKKAREALKKSGCNLYCMQGEDGLVAKPSYEASSELTMKLLESWRHAEIDRVVLVYNHFVSTGKQIVVAEQLLPIQDCLAAGGAHSNEGLISIENKESDCIFEPSREEIAESLLPRLSCMRLHAAVLDSQAAEHAARMVAMQAASDNAEKLLAELRLEYNKARQQKITAEILDLAGGAL